MTYIDISFKGDVQLNIFLSLLDYDRSSLKLVSASFEKDLSESDSGELSPDSNFSATEAGVIAYFEDGIKNIDMSGDHTIRLGFEVNEEAAEGEYKIGLSNMDTGSLTGLSKIDKDEEGNFMIVYVPVNYISGSVKVSNTETPKTGLKAKPLRRAYASVEGVDLSITGDVNEDGSINAMDIVKVKQYFVGSEEKVKNADANEDGVVNIADILTLAENIAG